MTRQDQAGPGPIRPDQVVHRSRPELDRAAEGKCDPDLRVTWPKAGARAPVRIRNGTELVFSATEWRQRSERHVREIY
jgi:hypothetical protein